MLYASGGMGGFKSAFTTPGLVRRRRNIFEFGNITMDSSPFFVIAWFTIPCRHVALLQPRPIIIEMHACDAPPVCRSIDP